MTIVNGSRTLAIPQSWKPEEFWQVLETLLRKQEARLEVRREGRVIVKCGRVFGYTMSVDVENGIQEGRRIVDFVIVGKPFVDMSGVRKILGGFAPDDVMKRLSEVFRKYTGGELSCEEGLKVRGEGKETEMALQVLATWLRMTGRVFSSKTQGSLNDGVKDIMPQWSAVWTFDGIVVQAITVDDEGKAEKMYDRMEFHVVSGRQKLGEKPGVEE